MRISDNQLSSLLSFYKSELESLYGSSETRALFVTAVEHFLHIPRNEVEQHLSMRLHQSEILTIYDCAKALKKHIPLQYILGEVWFMDVKLKVNSSVLIPRPETEELCDRVIKENPSALGVLDIGTGSGCIPLALKKHMKEASVYACDVSETALQLAAENSKHNQLEINFFQANVLNLKSFIERCKHKFDLILSNPPYILESEKNEMEKQVLDHEPHLALFVEGNDPVLFYRKIIELCEHILLPEGKLYFELNPVSAWQVSELATQSQLFSAVEILNDMSGKQRFLRAVRTR